MASIRIDTLSMPQAHETALQRPSGQWALGGRGVAPLPRAGRDRLLCLRSGRLWLTGPGDDGREADVWLEAGDCATLPAGTAWLAGAEPSATWVMLELPAQPAHGRRGFGFFGRRGAVGASRAVDAFGAAWTAWLRNAAAIARRAQGAISAADSRASAGIVQ